MAKAKPLQWVNLEKDPKFVEDEVKSLARAGHLHVECKFQNAKPSRFKVRVVAKNPLAGYTATEVPRNQNFKIRHTKTHTNVGKANVKLEEDVYLPAAGGCAYQIEAKHRRKVVQSSLTVETRRKVYYQPIAMAGVSVPGLGPTEAAYEKLFVTLKAKGAGATIPFVNNTQVDDWARGRLPLIQAAKGAYAIAKYEKSAFVAAFINMIASQETVDFDVADSPEFTVGARVLSPLAPTVVTYTLPSNKYLWYGLDPADDAAHGGKGLWLSPNRCNFVDTAGKKHLIPDTNISIDLTKTRTAMGGYNTLKIEIPKTVQNFFSSRKGRFEMQLVVVEGFSGGYSEPSINIITVAKSAWWVDNSDPARLQILNHEMGHKLGMLPEGLSNHLDAPGTLYGGSLAVGVDQKGHQGPHCDKGCTYVAGRTPEAWHGVPECVMFGATSCFDPGSGGHVATPATYCGECEKRVKKLDLEGRGLPGLANSVTKY
jgi:hypothetical protein